MTRKSGGAAAPRAVADASSSSHGNTMRLRRRIRIIRASEVSGRLDHEDAPVAPQGRDREIRIERGTQPCGATHVVTLELEEPVLREVVAGRDGHVLLVLVARVRPGPTGVPHRVVRAGAEP